MPTVPYQPYTDVKPTEAGTPGLRVSPNPTAFGATVAQAIEHLGGSIEHAGNEIWNRAVAIKETDLRAKADEVNAEFTKQAGLLQEDFKSKEGANAGPEALEGHLSALENMRKQFAQKLDAPFAQKLFNSESRGMVSRLTIGAAGHSAAQHKVYVDGAAEARIDAAKQHVRQFPEALEEQSKKVEALIRGTQGPLRGLSPELTDEKLGKALSAMTRNAIEGTADTRPIAANEMLELNRGKIRDEDWRRAEATVKNRLHGVAARDLAREFNPIVPDGEEGMSEKEKIEKAVAKAEKMVLGDPEFVERVRTAVGGMHRETKRLKTEYDNANYQTVYDALTTPMPNGRFPVNEDQVRSVNERVYQAWDYLAKTDKKRYAIALRQLQGNASGDFRPTPEGIDRISVLKGKITSGEDIDAFDILKEPLIPNSVKNELLKFQKQMRGPASQSPRVMQAMKQIGEKTLSDAGFDRSLHPDKYHMFVDSLRDALEDFAETHKGRPNTEEVRKIGAQLMHESIKPGLFGWTFGPFGTKETTLEPDLPDNKVEAVKAEIRKKYPDTNIEAVTKEQIRRQIVRREVMEAFKSKKAPGLKE